MANQTLGDEEELGVAPPARTRREVGGRGGVEGEGVGVGRKRERE